MGTRAVVNFTQGENVCAKVYRHWDGYFDGLGQDLLDFLKYVMKNVPDNRFKDASYLASKWVVKDSERYANKNGDRLSFLSVGIVMENPGDIEFEYFVDCSKLDENGFPTVKGTELYGNSSHELTP